MTEAERIAQLEERLRQCREELAAARLQLDMFSATDPVSGLANPHGISDAIRNRLDRLDRNGTPLAVIGVSFPEIAGLRSAHGDQFATGAVRHTGSVLNAAVRALDLVGRLDETTFAVVLDEADPGQLEMLMGRISHAMASLPLQFADETVELGAIVAAVTAPHPTAVTPENAITQLQEAVADSTAAVPQIRRLHP